MQHESHLESRKAINMCTDINNLKLQLETTHVEILSLREHNQQAVVREGKDQLLLNSANNALAAAQSKEDSFRERISMTQEDCLRLFSERTHLLKSVKKVKEEIGFTKQSQSYGLAEFQRLEAHLQRTETRRIHLVQEKQKLNKERSLFIRRVNRINASQKKILKDIRQFKPPKRIGTSGNDVFIFEVHVAINKLGSEIEQCAQLLERGAPAQQEDADSSFLSGASVVSGRSHQSTSITPRRHRQSEFEMTSDDEIKKLESELENMTLDSGMMQESMQEERREFQEQIDDLNITNAKLKLQLEDLKTSTITAEQDQRAAVIHFTDKLRRYDSAMEHKELELGQVKSKLAEISRNNTWEDNEKLRFELGESKSYEESLKHDINYLSEQLLVMENKMTNLERENQDLTKKYRDMVQTNIDKAAEAQVEPFEIPSNIQVSESETAEEGGESLHEEDSLEPPTIECSPPPEQNILTPVLDVRLLGPTMQRETSVQPRTEWRQPSPSRLSPSTILRSPLQQHRSPASAHRRTDSARMVQPAPGLPYHQGPVRGPIPFGPQQFVVPPITGFTQVNHSRLP